MFIGKFFYKCLRLHIDKIVEFIYIIVLKNIINIGKVSIMFEIGFNKLAKIIKWFYFIFFIIICSYIINIFKYLEKIIIIIFKYFQNIFKIFIEFILSLTGPLSQEIINNIWLLFVLICVLIILNLSIKIIKNIIIRIKERNKEKELFIKELISKLKEQDEIINKQIKELKNEELKNENIKEIKIKEVVYKIDINKIRK